MGLDVEICLLFQQYHLLALSEQVQKTKLRININIIYLNIVKPTQCKVRNFNNLIDQNEVVILDSHHLTSSFILLI